MKAYKILAEALVEQGAHTMFGVMGDANMQIIAHYKDVAGGRYLGATHEAGAIEMADGFHRISGEIGFATATHGPGFTNTLTALTEAGRNRSQLVVITGDTPPERTWTQALDIGAAVAPTGAGYERVYRLDSIEADLARAIQRATIERRPVVLNFPYALMQQETDPHPIKPSPPLVQLPPRPDDSAYERALDLIAGADRPLVLAGRGAARSNAREEIIAFADALGAPLSTSLLGRDLFAGHPLNLGIVGSLGHSIALDAIGQADVIIAFGAGLNRYTTDRGDLFKGKRVLQVDTSAENVGIFLRVDELLLGDAKEVAATLTGYLKEAEFEPSGWAQRFAPRLAEWTPESEFDDKSANGAVDVRSAVIALDRVLPKDRIVVSDVGRFLVAAWRYLSVEWPLRFTHTSTFGSIGLGLGTALGAAVADPSRLTVGIMGDGGFMMSGLELSTAARYKLPILVVVVNDGAYGAEYTKLKNHGEDPKHSLVEWPELGPLAEAMGARTLTVRSLEDFGRVPALIDGLEGPAFVDVRLDPLADVGHW